METFLDFKVSHCEYFIIKEQLTFV